jgi:hypothetical protein
MKDNTLQIILDEQKVAKENAEQLLKAFGAPFTEAGKILSTYKDIVVTDESQTELMLEARKNRLALKAIRTGVENKRKDLKADYLTVTNAIDGVARYIKNEIEPAEEYLETQEKFGELKRAERAATLKAERVEKLMQYTDNISVYNLDGMTDEDFDQLLATVKSAYDAKIAKAQADAEELRLAEVERIKAEDRMKEENAKLRKAQEKAETEREIERKKQAKKDAEIKARHDAEVAAERAKADDERKKREQVEEDQRKKDAIIAKEKYDREQSELKAKKEADELATRELLAPDKDKILHFNDALETIRKEKLPAVKTKQAQDIVNFIDDMFIKMRKIIAEKAGQL